MKVNKLKKISRSLFAGVMAFSLVLPTAVPSFADTPSTSNPSTSTVVLKDISKHWAKSYIEKAVTKGLVNGYSDNTFKPDNPITRAEFIKMLNAALGNTGTSTETFTDVSADSWYKADVNKAIAAAYVSGYEDGKFLPNNNITRQEAAVMLARIVPTYGTSKTLKVFGDEGKVASWAYEAVGRIYGKGYLGPYNDGDLHPLDKLTRAQAAKILVDFTDKEKIVNVNQTIVKSGVTVTNTIFANQFSIGEGVEDGNAVISNCVILGALNVRGGGTSNYVTLQNSRLAECMVRKEASPVKVLMKGETTVKKMTVSNIAIIEESDLAGNTFSNGVEKIELLRAAEATLYGSFDEADITGAKVDLVLKEGTIEALNVGHDTDKTTIAVERGSSIKNAIVNSGVEFIGKGTIKNLYVYSNGVTYETEPENIQVASGVDKPEFNAGTGESNIDSDFIMTISPENNAKNVAVDSNITISFDTAVTHSDGTAILSSDIEDLVSLRKNSSSGTAVPFSGSINSAKTRITITPDSYLAKGAQYFLVIPSKSFEDAEGNLNASRTVSFTVTNEEDVLTTTFSPVQGASDVSTSVQPTISFSDSIVRYSGSSVTSSYLMNEAISLRQGGSSGKEISFSASINSSNNKITITPDSLNENATYYLGINSSKLKTSNGEIIRAQGVTWTVGSASLTNLQVSPGDKYISVSATSGLAGTMYSVAIKKSGSSSVPTAAQVMAGKNSSGGIADASASVSVAAKGNGSLELSGLSTTTAYNVYTVLEDKSGNLYTVFSNSVTTEALLLKGISVRPVYSNGSLGSNVLSGFKPEVSNYTVTVPGDSRSVLVTPDVGAFAGTVQVNGYDPSTPVDLTSATTNITVSIKETGKSAKQYTLAVVRQPEISGIYIDSINVTNKIVGTTIEYTPVSGKSQYSIVISTTDSKGSFEIYTAADKKISDTISSGGSVTLTPGNESKFKILVYSANKASSITYTLNLG